MTESDPILDHYSEQLRLLIWSGFFDRLEFQNYLDDLQYDEEAAPYLDRIREYGETEFVRKTEAEQSWPKRTDWDRLNDAFETLNCNGVLALHNAGYTSSDAHSDAWQIIKADAPGEWAGFCFYHGQDVERAVQGMPLYIGFDAVAEDARSKSEIGNRVAKSLRDSGFTVEWNGDPETRMTITNLDWKKRTAPRKPGILTRLFGKAL